jgi:hypothetical protein
MMRIYKALLPLIVAACALVCAPAGLAQVAGQNVNMVSGTSWPGGDPFLQRQNEPSMAVSTRNPMHLLAGSNDYRTVDLELALSEGEETGDSWLGLFKSFDGGLTWRSTLLPGCKYADPQCRDNGALFNQYDAGSDPVVRAGTNGMFYYAGLAFDRSTSSTSASSVSTIFVARFNDLNNNENADPITYIDTHIVKSGSSSQFLDKPALAVDIPRSGALTCSFTAQEPGVGPNGGALSVHQSFATGNVYMTYTDFLQGTKDNATPTRLMFTRSTDCGVTWGTPVQLNTGTTTSQGSAIAVNALNGNVYVSWRQFKSTGISDAIMVAQSKDAGRTFSAPVQISTFTPFDQGTTGTSFRTNAYPSITTDMFGFVYVAFSAKGLVSTGDARVVAAGSIDGTHWTPAIMVDNPSKNAQTNPSGRGHQIMPAITFANGRLTLLYYDLRLDHYQDNYTSSPNSPTGYTATLTPEGELPANPSKVFTPFIDDAGLTLRRHTLDMRVLQLGIFPTVTLGPSVVLSQYAYGCCVNPNSPDIEQFKFNVPNLPIFSQGEVPFLGDYIDVVPSPAFVPSGNSWVYNFTPSVNPLFHATWTDNRDVVPPANGDWTHYTPPVPAGTTSVFQPGQPVVCTAGQEGMRNQNIYTAQITGGLVVGTPGNAKPLGTTVFNGRTVPFQRAFAVEAQNVTNSLINVRFTIANQPTGGKASFMQFSQLTTLDISIPALSSVSRSVFVTSTNAEATVTVNVVQINSIGGSTTTNGLSQSAVLNPDVTNPNITNPNVTNPNVTNPNITNFEVTNPNVTNPNITNPNVTNPNITNPNVTNPNITNPNVTNPNVTNVSATNPNVTNPNITNPDVTNPNITNPNITNPNVTNGAIQDVLYPLTNNGNTTATYTVQVATPGGIPTGVLLQLILDKLYQTPVATDCQLTTETHWVTVANIINPKIYAANDPKLGNPNITNSAPNEASITLAPGETAYITLRVFSPTKTPVNPLQYFIPVTVPQAENTQTALANPGGTTPPPVTVPPLTISTTALPDAIAGHAYSTTLAVQGGNPGAHTWSVSAGTLPTGLTLNTATGTISGPAPSGAGSTFTIQVRDTAIGTLFPQHTTTQQFTLRVDTPLTLNPMLVGTTPLTGGTQGAAYNQSILPVGGVAPVTIALISGSVPAGLSFVNGNIIGTPTGTGLSTFTVQATDSSHPPQVITQVYSINIVSAAANAGMVSWVNQPTNSVGGQVIPGTPASPLSVQVFDNTHAVLPGVSVTMSFNGTAPCSAAVLSGTLTRTTDATGTASFNDLSIDRGQFNYSLRAAVTAAPTILANSNSFRVSGFCAAGTMNAARSNHVAVKLGNGAVLIAGGTNTAGTSLASAESRAPDGSFVPNNNMQAARASFTGTLLTTGPNANKVLLAGGIINGSGTPSVEIFDPGTGNFTLGTSHMTNGRYAHTATLLPNGDVLIAGGSSSFGNDNNNAEVYHAADGTFSSLITMTSTHTGGTATLLANGKVLIAGGLMLMPSGGGSVETAIATAELFDPSNNTFTATGSMHTARTDHIAVLLPNGLVLVGGGTNASNMSEGSAELYDPTAGTFSTTGSMTPRGNAAAVLLGTGKVLVIGGGAPQSNVAQLYDPVAGTFSTILPMLSARADFPAVLLNDGTVLATGGFNAPNVIANAELYYPDLGTLSVATTALPNGLVGVPYTATINTIGGTPPISFSVTQASFPPGLLITQPASGPTSDTLTGTPSTPGTYSFFEGVADSGSPQQMATQNYTVTIANPLSITTTSLPDARTDSGSPVLTYSAPIGTAGGLGATTFSIISGAPPPTITLDPATGVLSSPAVTNVPTGTYNFTVRAVSAGPPSSTATQALSIKVNPFFTGGTPNQLPSGTVGTPYSAIISSSGGVPPYSYSLAFGNTPPPGLTLTTGSPNATLSGTPTATETAYSFNIQASDSSSPPQSYVEQLTITIGAPAGPPVASMSFSTQPTNSIGGQFVNSPFPAVTALDAGSNPVPNATITMSIANNPCTTETENLVLTTSAVTNASGVATFSQLRLTPAGKPGFTLLATAPSAVTTTSASFLNVGSCNTANSPHATRSGATTTLLQDGTILIAGGEDSGGPVNTAEIYNPADSSFTPTTAFAPPGTTMNVARSQHTATLLSNGQVLIVGGATGLGTPTPVTNRLELYDPSSHTFILVSQELATARTGHTATLLPNGSAVLIAGGFDGTNPVGTAQVYQNATLSTSFNMITPRNQASAILLPSGNVLITGGFTPAFPTGTGDNTAELYNPFGPSNAFTAAGGLMTSGHIGHTMTVLNPTSGTVLIAGGENGSSNCLQTAEIFSSSAGNTFTSTGSMNLGRCLHSATTLSNGKILMFGGFTIFGHGGASVNDLYDPTAGTFSSDALVQTPRAQMGAVRLSDGTVFIVGGTIAFDAAIHPAEIYYPAP